MPALWKVLVTTYGAKSIMHRMAEKTEISVFDLTHLERQICSLLYKYYWLSKNLPDGYLPLSLLHGFGLLVQRQA